MTKHATADPLFIHLGNAQSGAVGAVGPFDFVQVTYNHTVRVERQPELEDFTIARFDVGMWVLDDGTEWSDLTVSTIEPEGTEGMFA